MTRLQFSLGLFLYKNSAEIIQNGHMHFHYFLHIDISCASANNFYTA